MELYQVPRLENESNGDYVYRSMRENIIKVALRPGEIISEPQLQKEFHMSRSPIREALSILKHEKLLSVQPKSGTRVMLINKEQIMESRYMRVVMERDILLKVLQMDTAPLTKQLHAIMDEAECAMQHQPSAVKVIFDYDSLFHRAVFDYAGFKYIWDMIRTTNIQYSRFLNLYVEEKLYGEGFLPDHRKLADWIAAKDKDALKVYVNTNYSRVAEYLRELEIKHPSYFEQ